MTENFNFRDLGSRNGRRMAVGRTKFHVAFLSNIYGVKKISKCNKVLQSCIDYTDRKIGGNELRTIHWDFWEEFLVGNNIPTQKMKNSTALDVTKTYLLLQIIRQCSFTDFSTRLTLNLINGYVALNGSWAVENEKRAQTAAYNKYMQKRQGITQTTRARRQPNVLYPNRRIFLPEESE